ncbi:DUF5119 domain-containing protein [Prevotella sp.]|uniref:DUF5119 domain-containing protein n=1 Tax=Prevotella sp. TaxID=59823 RepID=UPI003DA62287
MKKLFFILIASLVLVCACDRRPLEYVSDENASIAINYDWETAVGETPSGVTLMAYGSDGSTQQNISNNTTHMPLNLGVGIWKMLSFNLSTTEFNSFTFNKMNNYDSAQVKLNDIESGSYTNGTWDAGVTYKQEPENLAVIADTIRITEDMISGSKNFNTTGSDSTTKKYVIKETPKPVNTKLTVRIRVNNINSIKSSIGSINGMAGGYILTSYRASTDKATFLLQDIKATVDSTGATSGWLTITLSTFGLPYGKENINSRIDVDNVLTLYFTLSDNKTEKLFTYNVGKIINYAREVTRALVPTSEVTQNLLLIINNGPELPKIDNSSTGGSGFEAEVDNWGEGGNIDIGI